MNSETKQCQNCKQNFVIEPDDFTFYEKMEVPPPTWCPECRMIRRLQFRNERGLYHFKCRLCGESGISMYPDDSPFPVYCVNCWYSDKWDQLSYGRDYDFSRPFFEQWKELSLRVPRASIFHRSVVQNAQYSNIVGESKNLYLSYSVSKECDGVYFSKFVDHSDNIYDCFSVVDSSQCYENISGRQNYNCNFLQISQSCIDCSFVFDCVNCRNCFLAVGLRNREYVIRNEQYTKEEYFKILGKINLGSRSNLGEINKEFYELILKIPHRYSSILKSVDSTGDNIINSKNAKLTFDAYNVENTKYVFRVYGLKDVYDSNNAGDSEMVYEFAGGGSLNSSRLLFSSNGIQNLEDVSYSDYCASDSHVFGVVSLRNKQYCILNKQYSKEKYEELVPRIIKHMNDMPYVDQKGRVYKYGEFFPPELSPFAFNETIAQEYFPFSKEQAETQGYRWKDPDTRQYTVTKQPNDLPDHIKDIDDGILKETIGCQHQGTCTHQCTNAFRIIPEELSFHRKMNLPLPRLCPNCRHYERLKQRNPLKLWHRTCQCSGKTSENGVYQNTVKHQHGAGKCPNEFETSYSPDRKEIIYCESCYNSEVV